MKMYSYLVEGLPNGQWRWTVFGDDHKAVGSGIAKGEREAKEACAKKLELDVMSKLRSVFVTGDRNSLFALAS
ncbi:MAG: hypothetical protein JJE37_08125 [Methyloceanibacter sp.]|nr:hypothetical protein [Methyloceanibacter sp.]